MAMNKDRLFTEFAIVSVILAAPSAWAVAPNQGPATPGQSGKTQTGDSKIGKGMSAAAQKLAADKKALALSHHNAIQALTQSAQWKTMSAAQRRAALRELNQKFVSQEHALNAAYQATTQRFVSQKANPKASGPDASGSAQTPSMSEVPDVHGAAPGMGRMGGGRGR